MVRPMLINLNPDELHYYPFIVSMNRCNGSCNAIGDLFDRTFVPNKMEVVDLGVLNIIKGIIESKTPAKHISCECRCEFDGRKCNLRQKWNNVSVGVSVNKSIKHCKCEEDYGWNPSICAWEGDEDCEIGEYQKDCACIKSLVYDLIVTYDEIVDMSETTSVKSVNKKGFFLTYIIFLGIICLTLLIFIAIVFYCHYGKH